MNIMNRSEYEYEYNYFYGNECLTVFEHYADEYGAGVWLLLSGNSYLILVLGLRAGILILHSNIFPRDDHHH